MCNTKREETVLTSEEIEKRKKDLMEYYEEQLPLLRLQHESEKLQSDIEEFRLRAFAASVRLSQLMQGPKEEKEEETKEEAN